MQRRTSFSWSALAASAALLAACNGDDGPRAPSTVAAVSATSLTGTVGELVGDPLDVRITDDRGAALGGIIVTFTVSAGGGTVTPAVDTTDNNGLASTRWRLGGTAGQQRVTASVTGVATSVDFTATAVAGAPASVAIQAGDNQSATVGAAVTTAPSVVVRDRFNNPVNGTSVFFSVAAGGGSVMGAGATTNASGVATVGSWTLGPNAGANRLTALVLSNGVAANPVTFNATATPGTAAAATATTATTITGSVGGLVTPVPSIRVVDANGNPVAGVSVTFAASTGSTVVNGTKTTGLNGTASPDGWQLGATAGTYTLTATATGLTPIVFTAQARAGAAAAMTAFAGNNQTATVGRTLPVDPAVRITDALGNPIVGQEVVFEVISGGGSALVRRPLTDANGVATVGAWTLGETPGTNTLRATAVGINVAGSPVTFTATATAGAPASMTLTAGNNQTATAGALVAIAPSVVVRDNRGNPVQGVTVTFTPGTGSGSVTGGSAVTNAAGVAAVGSWRLGTVAGAQTLTASLPGLPDVVFSATATAGTASVVAVVGDSVIGNVPVNSSVGSLPTVRVLDALGNGVGGVQVTFEAVNGTGNVLGGTVQTTGANGQAQLTSWQIGTVAGVYRVRASIAGVTSPSTAPTWVVTGVALAPSSIVLISGTPAGTATGTLVSPVPVVQVRDVFSNPVAGVSVTFSVQSGQGTVGGGSATSIVTTTNELGEASVGAWRPVGASGETRVLSAAVGGVAVLQISVTIN